MNTYTLYHLHSKYSLLDSTTDYKTYVDFAADHGMTAIGTSEHGNIFNWVSKANYAHQKGLKFLFGVEAYLTETHEQKVRDNYHVVLYAKNEQGRRELIRAISNSNNDDHFYYKNRISFEEFCNMSDNIISTSACLASPLNGIKEDNPWFDRLCRRFDFFEVQPHENSDQMFFNTRLRDLSHKYHKPLIAGTDTHSADVYAADCRKLLMARKKIMYSAEDDFDLTLKTYEQLYEMFTRQGVFSDTEIKDVIDNTMVLASMIEDTDIDTSMKYPLLYGSSEKDNEVYFATLNRKFSEKVKDGTIPVNEIDEFKKRITEENEVFKKLNTTGYMLFESELIDHAHSVGIPTGFSRGSVGGSCAAYVLGITDLDPVKYGTLFSRFLTVQRKDDPDIDTDIDGEQREEIFKYITERFGDENVARVLTFNTNDAKGAIDDINGGLYEIWNMQNLHEKEIKQLKARLTELSDDPILERKLQNATEAQEIKDRITKLTLEDKTKLKENPYTLDYGKRAKAEYESDPESARKKFPNIFYFFDGMMGTIISTGMHAAGMVVSPVNLCDNYGTMFRDGARVLQLTMDDAHDARLVKYDLLGVSNIGILRDACKMAGVPFPKAKDINFDETEMWDDIVRSPVGVFQFESASSFKLLRTMRPRSVEDLSILTAALRPGAASFRDEIVQRHVKKNANPKLDTLLKETYGYVLYQESITQFLTDICGFETTHADDVRKAICKKKEEQVEAAIPDIVEGYCNNVPDVPREEAEAQVAEFIQVVRDAGSYAFNKSHAIGYSLLTAALVYMRCHYPYEFITSYLMHAKSQEDIANGTELARMYNIKITSPKFGLSRADYTYDKVNRVITKGVASVKYMNNALSERLYTIYHEQNLSGKSFVTVLNTIKKLATKMDVRKIDILIKIGYFEEYGEINTLLAIHQMLQDLKYGDIKSLSKISVPAYLVDVGLANYGTDVLKSGGQAKTWTITDPEGLIEAAEDRIRAEDIPVATIRERMEYQKEFMGYVSLATGDEADRRKLIVTKITPLIGQYSPKPWSYRYETVSVQTGKSAVLYARKNVRDNCIITEGDVIYVHKLFKDNKGYWQLSEYSRLVS